MNWKGDEVLKDELSKAGNMSKKEDAEWTFKNFGQDPRSWLQQAVRLKLSSEAIWRELEAVRARSDDQSQARENTTAYIDSFMLLSALAFENVIKGILVGRDKTVIGRTKIDRCLWKDRGGHGIEQLARKVGNMNPDELGLLKRMEEFLVWGGRYPLPLSFNDYYKGRDFLVFRATDLALRDRLFDRLAQALTDERNARIPHY
jgi:hypothetical protein